MNTLDSRTRSVIAWVAVALGQGAFLALHLVQFLGDLAKETDAAVHAALGGHDHDHGAGHDHDHLAELTAMSEPGMLWMFVIWQVAVLAPVVIALLGKGKGVALATLIVGGLGALAGTLDGFNHAIADGMVHSAVASVLLVGLPGVIAVLATVAWLKEARKAPATA